MLYSFKFLGKRNANIQNGKNQTQLSRWSVEDKGENPVNAFSRIFFLMLSLSLLFLIGNYSCRETPTGTVNSSDNLITVEDVGVTDAVLKLHKLGGSMPREIRLKRDTTTIIEKTMLSPDTIIIDEGLLPKHTYRYELSVGITKSDEIESEVQITTMDTTSHNFTWQIDTLGTHSSVLYDVAIINDTLVYAVGEIFHSDSSENWTFFNLAKWNGRQWTLQRLYYQGNTIMHLRWILAFNERDIWVNSITHWNGVRWEEVAFDPIFYGVSTNKAWGTSSSDFYVVGNGGFIAHYDGSVWRKLESGTDVDLLDIWGSPDGSIVWACGWEDFKPTVLLKYQHSVWKKQYEDNLNKFRIRQDSLSGVLVSGAVFNKRLFVLTNTGLYKTTWDTRGEGNRLTPYPEGFRAFPFRLRGNTINDIFVVGQRSLIAHNNGMTFSRYEQFMDRNIMLYSVDQKGNTVIAVGEIYHPIYSKGIVFRGSR
jgi:hypothetical protein